MNYVLRNINPLLAAFLSVFVALSGCKSTKDATKTQATGIVYVDEEDADWGYAEELLEDEGPYQASYARTHDLIHTKLEVSFDWEKQRLNGKATLTLRPYFYPTGGLFLDAKGFDIHEIAMVEGDSMQPLNYRYDDFELDIALGKVFTRNDTFIIYIEYTAKPEELPEGGSMAITSDKGLYFINPLNEEPAKPQQIWTQGETEASSCWFPTIDAPNERCTEEIYITVNKRFKTLSNGLLISSTENEDGTRTDYWKQDMPHAPYLFMMAIGDFAVVKEEWKGKEVSYYVEHEYEPYAKAIFGNTPEMLTFYSDVLGVEYPWGKYSQVVVRDYVSGAMENTSATIHGEFVQRTDRELLDETYEDIISHELFHHWFGDLVTCESWANLPLNESFATYGEYLWREYKYGRESADEHLQGNLKEYMQQGAKDKKDLIRFHYEDKEDMFDTHSYSKGGRILHMLRKYVGDDAFFASLNLYLQRHQFTDVEIHELRIAFEDVTGEDLNWFFNQWFLDKGHPEIEIDYVYEATSATVIVSQNQDLKENPLYTIPMKVDIYAGGKKERFDVVLDNMVDTFFFATNGTPDLINVDAEKMLLCVKRDNKTMEQYIFQYKNAPLYLDRYEAIESLADFSSNPEAIKVITSALDDSYKTIRVKAISTINGLSKAEKDAVKEKLISVAKNDKEASVRTAAINSLSTNYGKDETLAPLYEAAIDDKAFSVVGAALRAINKLDKEKGLISARKAERDARSSLLYAIATIFAESGDKTDFPFFQRAYPKVSDFGSKYGFVSQYTDYLKKQPVDIILKGLPLLEQISIDENTWFIRLSGVQGMGALVNMAEDKIANLSELQASSAEVEQYKKLRSELIAIAKKGAEKEDNNMVIMYLNGIKNKQ